MPNTLSQPKIVVLDGHTLNPGDLSWDNLKALGSCEIYERSAPDEIVPRSRAAAVVLTNKAVISRAHLAQLPELKYIGVTATGYNIVDVEAARERGITVTNVPAYGTQSVAQMTIALLLELCQHVGAHAQTVREGRWARSPDFCYWTRPLTELHQLTFGVVGLGQIGAAVARLAAAFGMRLLAYAPRPRPVEGLDIRFVPLDQLLSESDVVSLHCPLTADTERLINRDRLALMKPTAFLLNTSRGPLIDEEALAEALENQRIAGAGLDVLATEPPPPNHPLYGVSNCFITPHIAWATRAARARLMQMAVQNLESFLNDRPVHVVN